MIRIPRPRTELVGSPCVSYCLTAPFILYYCKRESILVPSSLYSKGFQDGKVSTALGPLIQHSRIMTRARPTRGQQKNRPLGIQNGLREPVRERRPRNLNYAIACQVWPCWTGVEPI